jgi:hypothetical protein
MTTLTITLSDDSLLRLKVIAARFQVSPEDLARLGVEELLSRPEESFQHAADYVLKKNADLYQRLV